MTGVLNNLLTTDSSGRFSSPHKTKQESTLDYSSGGQNPPCKLERFGLYPNIESIGHSRPEGMHMNIGVDIILQEAVVTGT